MQFPPPRPRPARETILPMINVVFLLLIFFLMTAQIAPAPPFDLTPPEAEAEAEAADLPLRVLWLGAEGQLVFDDDSGEQALDALAGGEGPVLIRADAGATAADLAQLMRQLSVRGITELRLATLSRSAP